MDLITATTLLALLTILATMITLFTRRDVYFWTAMASGYAFLFCLMALLRLSGGL